MCNSGQKCPYSRPESPEVAKGSRKSRKDDKTRKTALLSPSDVLASLQWRRAGSLARFLTRERRIPGDSTLAKVTKASQSGILSVITRGFWTKWQKCRKWSFLRCSSRARHERAGIRLSPRESLPGLIKGHSDRQLSTLSRFLHFLAVPARSRFLEESRQPWATRARTTVSGHKEWAGL